MLLEAAPALAPPPSGPRPAATPGHYYFPDSGDEESPQRLENGPEMVPERVKPPAEHSAQPQPAAAQGLPAAAAVTGRAAAGPQHNLAAPAPRASTLAEVFAARGKATAAHAEINGRGAGTPAHTRDLQHAQIPWSYGNAGPPAAPSARRQYIREPQVQWEALPMLQRSPVEGDIIAYKLLEIAGNFTPQV